MRRSLATLLGENYRFAVLIQPTEIKDCVRVAKTIGDKGGLWSEESISAY